MSKDNLILIDEVHCTESLGEEVSGASSKPSAFVSSEGARLALIVTSEKNNKYKIITNENKFRTDLITKGYKGNIDNIFLCGQPIEAFIDSNGLTGYISRNCGCGTISIPQKHKCSLRICPRCSKIRRERILRQYLPLFISFRKQYPDKKFDVNFLTINPPNFDNLEDGYQTIRKWFKEFLKDNYIKERVLGGIYVIEAKKSKKDNKWNVHIHFAYFGRYIDNEIRGSCDDCNQNRLRWQNNKQKYYCANKKCKSSKVSVIGEGLSKIRTIWKEISGNDVHMDIGKKSSARHTLSYVLKYCSASKENFQNQDDLVEYLSVMHRKRVINKIGKFYNSKIKPFKKEEQICDICNEKITYKFELDYHLLDQIRNSKPYLFDEILKEPPEPRNRIPDFLKKSNTSMRIKERKLSKRLKDYV